MKWEWIFKLRWVFLCIGLLAVYVGCQYNTPRFIIVEQNNTLITEKLVEINFTKTEIIQMPCVCSPCPVCPVVEDSKARTGNVGGAWKNESNGTAWYHSMECSQYVGCKY